MQPSCFVCKCSPPTVAMNNAPRCRASVAILYMDDGNQGDGVSLKAVSEPVLLCLIYLYVE